MPAGVADTVRDRLGEHVVDVRLDTRTDDLQVDATERIGRPPQELFAAFLEERQIEDKRIPELFAELLEDELGLEEGSHAAA